MRNLLHHIIELIQRPHLAELALQVREHPAGDLADEDPRIRAEEFGLKLGILRPHLTEMLADRQQVFLLEPGVVARAVERFDHGFRRHVTRTAGERADRGIDTIGAGFDRAHQDHRRDAGRGVGVDMDRHAEHRLEGAHQFKDRRGAHQGGHVLDGDRLAAHRLQLLRLGHELIQRVDRRNRIADRALSMGPAFHDGLDGGLDVAVVVERIEDAEYVYAVFDRLIHEAAQHVIAVMPITQNVLPAQQHLQRRVGDQLLDFAQALPRIFIQKAKAGVESRAAPALHGPVADLVDLLANRQHILQPHTRGEEALMRVPQHELRDMDGLERASVHAVGRGVRARGRRNHSEKSLVP